MKMFSVLLIAVLTILPNTFAFGAEESPKQGIQAIMDLYKAKDFEKLIRERYSEIYKAEAQGKVDVLIEKFSKRFSNENKVKQVIQMYEMVLKVEPEITINPKPRETETDKMAIFNFEKGPYKLYLQKSGKWGFHM